MTDTTEPSSAAGSGPSSEHGSGLSTLATAAFADALRTMSGVLDELPVKLEGTRVHDFAFGKLFEASEVRDAYHQRLPETENDLAEAKDVIAHFIAGLEGGHPIAPVAPGAAPDEATPTAPTTPTTPTAPSVPEQTGRAEQ